MGLSKIYVRNFYDLYIKYYSLQISLDKYTMESKCTHSDLASNARKYSSTPAKPAKKEYIFTYPDTVV